MHTLDSKLLELSKIFTDDNASFSYLLRILRKKHTLLCPNCAHQDFYIMCRYRLKCKACRKEFRPLVNTKFHLLNIPFSRWLYLIKLFDRGYTVNRASKEAGLSYKTTLKAFNIIRIFKTVRMI